MKTPLGKLERIPLRKAWVHEAGEFTPWLAQAALPTQKVFRPLVRELS